MGLSLNLFWTMLLATDLLLPIVLILSGWTFVKHTPPYSQNALFGYRTKRSKLSSETWEFAHKHFGKTACVLGVVMIPLSILPLLMVMNGDSLTIAFIGLLVIIIQTIVFICAMLPTERALKEEFDDFGYRR